MINRFLNYILKKIVNYGKEVRILECDSALSDDGKVIFLNYLKSR